MLGTMKLPETRLVVVLTGIILFLNIYPWIVQLQSVPPNHSMLPVHNSTGDYPLYTSFIRQGLDGASTVRYLFVPGEQEGSYLYWFYLCIGRIGRFVGMSDVHVVYHTVRYLLSVVWFTVLYAFLRTVIHEKKVRIAAYVFILFSSSFPIIQFSEGGFTVGWYFSWWTEWNPMLRAAFLPHYMAGHTLMLTTLLFFCGLWERKKYIFLPLAIVSGWMAGFIHPPSLIILLLILPLYVLLLRKREWVIQTAIFTVGSAISLFFISRESTRYPWYIGRGYESLSFAINIRDALLGLGPVLFLGLIGAVITIKRRHTLLFVLWVVSSIVMLDLSWRMVGWSHPIFHLVPISNIRFLQTALWVPLGILSAQGLAVVSRRFGNIWWVGGLLLFILLTAIGYPYNWEGYYKSIVTQNEFDIPTKEWSEAMRNLSDPGNVSPVLAMGYTSAYIPAYSGRSVYMGFHIMPDYDARSGNSYTFYKGMDYCDAYAFLTEQGIYDIYFGFDEQKAGYAVLEYPFLKEVKRFGNTSIYTFIDKKPDNCTDI